MLSVGNEYDEDVFVMIAKGVMCRRECLRRFMRWTYHVGLLGALNGRHVERQLNRGKGERIHQKLDHSTHRLFCYRASLLYDKVDGELSHSLALIALQSLH